jgi:hypothetical protein
MQLNLKEQCPNCHGEKRGECNCNPSTRFVDKCEKCNGLGNLGTKKVTRQVPMTIDEIKLVQVKCNYCIGSGNTTCPQCEGLKGRDRVCHYCADRGYIDCSHCKAGYVYENKLVSVQKTESCISCNGMKWFPCESCSGEGFNVMNGKRVACNACSGKGEFWCETCKGEGITSITFEKTIDEKISCDQCQGNGSYHCTKCDINHHRICSRCSGKGQVYSLFGKAIMGIAIIIVILILDLVMK